MMKLQLVDETTFEAVIALKVAEKDRRRVASNLYSLAESWLHRDKGTLFPYAVLIGTKVVGFLLLSKEKEEGRYFIWRLMIDQKEQSRGYGTEVLRTLIRMAKDEGGYDQIVAHYVVGNHRMRSLLESLGFHTAGLLGHEVKMVFDIK